jgi:hypothetical protein
VEVEYVDDARKRYLPEEELPRLMVALDKRMFCHNLIFTAGRRSILR